MLSLTKIIISSTPLTHLESSIASSEELEIANLAVRLLYTR